MRVRIQGCCFVVVIVHRIGVVVSVDSSCYLINSLRLTKVRDAPVKWWMSMMARSSIAGFSRELQKDCSARGVDEGLVGKSEVGAAQVQFFQQLFFRFFDESTNTPNDDELSLNDMVEMTRSYGCSKLRNEKIHLRRTLHVDCGFM